MAGLGAPELLILLVVVLLLFGSTRLPKLARSIASAKREFQQAQHETTRAVTNRPDEAA